MRFQVILEKTLDDLMKLKRMAILVVLGAALTVLMVYLMGSEENMSLEMRTQMVLDYFTLFVFLWTTGFVLAMTVATTAAGFIAKEHDDGTLLLLVTKPINRFEIVLGKFLALMISSLLLQGVTLCGCVVVLWALLSLDPYTVEALLGLLPWMFLYSVLVILIFGAMAVALSTLMRSRVKIMLILMVVVMLTFFIGMMPRTVLSTYYAEFYLYYGDLGYHLGNTYVLLLDQSEDWRMIPSNQVMMAAFSGTYPFSPEGAYDPDVNAWPPTLGLTNYVQPAISLLIWLAVIGGGLALSAVAMRRKEVY
jgi:ABC-type transport system involved in multi-copper enzyme maturation permease subunit